MSKAPISKMPNVPIIGGGPAGMSCALWLDNYGLAPIIIEQAPELGGMARASPYPNDWLLGRPGETARQNAAAFARHVRQAKVECWLGARPQRATQRPDGGFELEVAFADHRAPQSLSCPAVVIAAGTRFRGQDFIDTLANARELAQRGRLHLGPTWAGEPGADLPGADLGSHVAVIGGGDNAFDVSRMLVEKGVKATIVMRSHSPHAQPLLVERLRAHQASGMADVMAGQTVTALDEAGAQIRVRISDGRAIDVDHVVLLFGYQPNADDPWLQGLALERGTEGHLVVDGNMETSCRGVFAVGDIANPMHPCIATAIGTGTMAAREIQRRLSAR
jgi:thioredoxin reductase (NADPH)